MLLIHIIYFHNVNNQFLFDISTCIWDYPLFIRVTLYQNIDAMLYPY